LRRSIAVLGEQSKEAEAKTRINEYHNHVQELEEEIMQALAALQP
jgi:hypothetical protein